VTFRLFDWNRLDARTDRPRTLQVDQALAYIDGEAGAVSPTEPILEETTTVKRERLFSSDLAVLGGLKECDALHGYQVVHFEPFDAVHNRTEAEVKSAGGTTFKVP
jgi:hypothetical protein